MQHGNADVTSQPNERPYTMRWTGMILLLLIGSLTSCANWRANPKPCDCGAYQEELRLYAKQYAVCLEDLGNTRSGAK